MLNRDDIEVILSDLNKVITENIEIFMIGGGAMSLKELKASTLDIDLVLNTKREFEILKAGLLKLNYQVDDQVHHINIYKQAVIVFLKGSSRIDIFIKSIVGMLDFTEAMQERSSLFKKFDRLNVMLTSNEDIFLLKSLSDREKDLPDNRTLIQTGLNWDSIIKECVNQHRKESKWIFWLYEQICRIEDMYDLSISVKSRIFRFCRLDWIDRPPDFMLDFDDNQIGKHLPVSEQKEIINKRNV